MPKVKVLARNWLIEINNGTDVVPEWVRIGGITSFTLSNDKEDTDTTDFDSGGYGDHIVAGRSFEISFEGFFLEDPTDATRDPGQQAVENLADKIGYESLGQFRMTSPSGLAKVYRGSVGVGDVGGGVTDATSWGATVTVAGRPTELAAGAAA